MMHHPPRRMIVPNLDNEDDIGKSNQQDDWSKLQRAKNGRVLSNLRNVLWVLRTDTLFKNVHFFNEMTHTNERRLVNGHDELQLIDDVYLMLLKAFLQNNYGLLTIGIDN